MKKVLLFLILSVLLNIALIFYITRLINGLGGMAYLKAKINHSSSQTITPAFYNTKVSIFNALPHHNNEIIFIGDSNIQYGEWNDIFENKVIHNRGIAGDDIQGVLLRINEDLVSKPSKLFVMIGINNLINNNQTDQRIASDYELLVAKIRTKSPATRLYLHSILPTYGRMPIFNKRVIILNKEISRLAIKYHATYINLFDTFKNKNGELNPDYSSDGTHLNGKGYMLWKETISSYVNE